MRSDARRALRRSNTVRSCTAASPAQRREGDKQRPLFLDGKTEREKVRKDPNRWRLRGVSRRFLPVPGPSRLAFVLLGLNADVSGPLSRDVVQPPGSACIWIFKNLVPLHIVCGNSNFSLLIFFFSFLHLCASI